MKKFARLREWARRLKTEIHALYLAYKDPRTPWYAKVFAACVVAYAFSPIDLIPDFIPVLGYLDDIILLPIGIALATRMIPRSVLEECRAKASTDTSWTKPVNWYVGALIISLWIAFVVAMIMLILRYRARTP